MCRLGGGGHTIIEINLGYPQIQFYHRFYATYVSSLGLVNEKKNENICKQVRHSFTAK